MHGYGILMPNDRGWRLGEKLDVFGEQVRVYTPGDIAFAVPELLYASSQIWSEQTNTFEMMIVLLLFYCLTIGAFVMLMNYWERKIAVPGWGKT